MTIGKETYLWSLIKLIINYWEVTDVTSPRSGRVTERTKLKLEFKTNQATII